MDIDKILGNFPKRRPTLSGKLKKIYQLEYKKNRDGGSPMSFLAQKLEAWMHKNISKARPSKQLFSCNTLEIGAGTLNQLFYETQHGKYDLIEPLSFLYKDSPYLPFIRDVFSDISEINLKTKYDRIISVAVLEHVENLPKLIKESINHLADGGVFACGIPSEGGFLWGLTWRLTTGLEFRLRTGLNYLELMQYEHINEASEIEALLKFYFKDVKIRRLGFGMHFSFYTYIECRNPTDR